MLLSSLSVMIQIPFIHQFAIYKTTYVCKENLPECTWGRCYHPVVWLKDTHTFTPTGNLEFALDL